MHADNITTRNTLQFAFEKNSRQIKLNSVTVLRSFQTPGQDAASLQSSPENQRLDQLVFTQPYVGEDVPAKLEAYINQCWKHLCSGNHPHGSPFPYTTIVQSSGCGKTRLVRELTARTSEDNVAGMKVLYACIRPDSSSGYPKQTMGWREHLFPALQNKTDAQLGLELSLRRHRVYHNALLAWGTVGRNCLSHFEDPSSGFASLQELSRQDSVRVTTQCNSQARTLVLVLDEARWLLDNSDSDKTSWFRRFRRALVKANDTIGTSFGTFAGIFAILVDSDPSIAHPMLDKITVKPIRDPSSRGLRRRECVDYPPFVVTEAIDVMYDAFLEKEFKQRYLEGKLSTGEDLY